MIFLTVGTQFPFDRLVKAVDRAAGINGFDEQIVAQIGDTSYRPQNFDATRSVEKAVFDRHFTEADSIISHAGMGTITMALEHRKPLLVMPRLKKYGEVVNDHQAAFARRFSELGHILAVFDVEDLPDGIRRLKNFVPTERKTNPEVIIDRIRHFLDSLQG